MAIRLKDHNFAFFEMIKTGTTFVREALVLCKIEFYEMNTFSYFCPEEDRDNVINYKYDFFRHSPWWAYKYVTRKVCTIRHPLAWYESMWKFYSSQDRKIKSGYIDIGFFESIPMEKDFNIFIDRCIREYPSLFTRMAEQFLGPTFNFAGVIKLENINIELYNVLTHLGYPHGQVKKILDIGKVNISPEKSIEWRDDQKEKILYLERKIINRFYDEK